MSDTTQWWKENKVLGTVAFPLTIAPASLEAAASPFTEQRKMRKLAENQAAEERARLAKLMAEKAKAIPDEEFAKRARRRSIAAIAKRRGRASTILTDDALATDTLG